MPFSWLSNRNLSTTLKYGIVAPGSGCRRNAGVNAGVARSNGRKRSATGLGNAAVSGARRSESLAGRADSRGSVGIASVGNTQLLAPLAREIFQTHFGIGLT